MQRQDRTESKVPEDSAWEIIYEKSTRKPLYHNKVTKLTVATRPRCLESKSGGRVSIKQPLVQVQYQDSWYKGILIGPGDKETFLVKLSDKIPEVGILSVHRDSVRQSSSPRKLSPPETKCKFKRHNVNGELPEGMVQRKRTSFVESDDEEDSLSKLSDGIPLSHEKFNWLEDEKIDIEFSLINPIIEVDDSHGDRSGKSTPNSQWSTEEDVESDEPTTLPPIQTFPKSQSKRRKERMNAVLLDWGDFKQVCQETDSKQLPPSDNKNIDLVSGSRRPSIGLNA
jgi:hypothetical protein